MSKTIIVPLLVFLLCLGKMSSIGNTSKGITQQGDGFFKCDVLLDGFFCVKNVFYRLKTPEV
jgi:hypothetical protein